MLALLDELEGALLGTCVAFDVGPTTSSSRTTFLSMAHTDASWTSSSGTIGSSMSILVLAKLSIGSSEVSSLRSSRVFVVASSVPSSLSQLYRGRVFGRGELGPNEQAGPLGDEKLVDPIEFTADVCGLVAFTRGSADDIMRRGTSGMNCGLRPCNNLSLDVLQ